MGGCGLHIATFQSTPDILNGKCDHSQQVMCIKNTFLKDGCNVQV